MSGTVVVFAGPTLSQREVNEVLPDAIVRPPAAQGDVLVAAQSGARVIGIIDGVFESVPAVWHKEILWAMSRGVHVLGSASMGALRAAELAAFGMEGVGEIYEAYAAGILDADDEVAVTHGPAEAHYRVQSDALVNVRSSVMAAVQAGAISERCSALVVSSAQSLFYPDRTYPRILSGALEAGADADEIERLRAFLVVGRIDQKRDDAMAMLQLIAERLPFEPKVVKYTFQRTHFFEQLWQEVTERGEAALRTASVFDEARLDPKLYAEATALAAQLSRAHEDAERCSTRFDDPVVLAAAAERYRRRRGLLQKEDFESHLRAHSLSERDFAGVVEAEARLDWHTQRTRSRVFETFETALQLLGKRQALHARALDKQAALSRRGLHSPILRDAGMSEMELFSWYFRERLQRDVPADLDAFLESTLHVDRGEFRDLLLCEYLFETA